MAHHDYGQPIYETFIGSNLEKDLTLDAIKVALNKAIENNAPLYITVISGKPTGDPPPPPPGVGG